METVRNAILVVDDSETVREVTSEMLRSAGFDVIEARSGQDALLRASSRPDLIVLDVNLPDVDGLEVCRRLRAQPDTAGIPVLYLTGTYAGVEDKVRGLETGADGYLTKPVVAAELVATVRALLRMRQAEAGFRHSEVRRRAAETLVELSGHLAQSLDADEVGLRIVTAVRRLFAAEAATLYRCDPGSGELTSLAVAGDVGPTGGRPIVIPPALGVSGRAVRERRPVTTPDALTDPRITLTPELRARLAEAPLRAALALPLVVRDLVVGALALGDRAGRVFTDEEIRLAQTFADQAALALDNARHLEEAQRALREAELLAALTRDIGASLDLDTVLQRVVNAARELCASDLARIALRDPRSGALVFRYWTGGAHQPYGGAHVAPGRGLGGQVLLRGQPMRTENRTEDPRFEETAGDTPEGIVAQLAVPIRIDGATEGLLHVDNGSARPFTDRDEASLMRLGERAAIAIQNARLFAGAEAARRAAETSEQRFRQSQQMLRAVIDAIPMMINAKDVQSRYIFMNRYQATLYGVSETAVEGKTASELLGEGYGAYTDSIDRRVLSTGEPMPYFEEEYQDAHGAGHTWLTTKLPLRDADAQVDGVVTIALDITDRKHLEAQLRQAQKMEAIGRLAGGVAHDFNNLLTVIGGRAELLRRRLTANDPLARHAELIVRTTERAAALTQQLLAFSRKQMLQPKLLDLALVVGGIQKMLHRLIGEHIELVACPAESLGYVRADPGQIEQVILNLAVNARDAMPDGGRLTLEVTNAELDDVFVRQHPGARVGRYVMLAVSDTGIGMSPEILAHLFEPFFTTKEVGKGTGLGLATVYGIVKQSGGYLAVSSEIGRGARFEIYLPRVEDADDAGVDGKGAGQVLTELLHGFETVLLVEDQEEVRHLARDILEMCGYTVIVARHGPDALHLAAQHPGPIHILVTDVVMPQMSGRELASQLGARFPSLKVLFVSGYTDDAVLRHGVRGQDTAYLPKPFRPEDLARRVRETLDGAPAGAGDS